MVRVCCGDEGVSRKAKIMNETNPTSQAAEQVPTAPRRSKIGLTANILVQMFLIAILAIIIFVMWLPAIVSKR